MTYDPRRDGADCDHCPMRRWRGSEWTPVPAVEASGRPDGILLGEAPGKREVEKGAPFVGPSGAELNLALKAARMNRKRYDVDNVIACRALLNRHGKDDYRLIEIRLKKDKAAGKSPDHEKHPSVHCRPRLDRWLKRSDNVIAMGATAANAVLGGAHSILSIRGGPAYKGTARVLPTVHPAFVARARRWQLVYKADLRRAERFFADRLEWSDAPILYVPTPAKLQAFLDVPAPLWTYDVETPMVPGPLHARINCVAIGRKITDDELAEWIPGPDDNPAFPPGEIVVVVPFRSIETGEPVYSPADQRDVRLMIASAFTDGRLWCGHNAGWYDRLVVEEDLGVTPAPLMDTIMLFRLAHSELPKALGVVGTIYTDGTAWKMDNEGNKLATDARSDDELWAYNAKEVMVTARIVPPIVQQVRRRQQDQPCPARPSLTLPQADHKIQSFCAGLGRVGLRIDPDAQYVMEKDLSAKVADARAAIAATLPSRINAINPASYPQVRKVLYGSHGFRLEPKSYTDTGEPSTGDGSIREHLMDSRTPGDAARFLWALRNFRSLHKRLTSFVIPLRRRSVDPEKGCVDDDGRLRVSWSAHGTTSGRLSSSQPMNVQNWEKILRTLVIPSPGNVLIGADYDQLEGRLGAATAGIKHYLRAYDAGLDAHQTTMHLTGGDMIWRMPGAPPHPDLYFRKEWPADPQGRWPAGGIGGRFDEYRSLNKNWYYGRQYGAGHETVWKLLREVEADCPLCKGAGCGTCVSGTVFTNRDLTLREVEEMGERFSEACPEMALWWERETDFFQEHGFNYEPLMGRRRFFEDGLDKDGGFCDVINFKIQPAAAALMNFACIDLVDAGVGCEFEGPGTGPIQQGHDSLLVEAPEHRAEEVRRLVEDCMTQTHPAFYGSMRFTATARITRNNWKEVA